MEGVFIWVNTSMVLAVIAAVIFLMMIKKNKESAEITFDKLSKVTGFVFVILVFRLCITSIILIWTDRSGN